MDLRFNLEGISLSSSALLLHMNGTFFSSNVVLLSNYQVLVQRYRGVIRTPTFEDHLINDIKTLHLKLQTMVLKLDGGRLSQSLEILDYATFALIL